MDSAQLLSIIEKEGWQDLWFTAEMALPSDLSITVPHLAQRKVT